MFDKKKIHFWILTLIFMSITGIVLFMLWNSPQEGKTSLITKSMGNMMKNMHISNAKISDLLKSEEKPQQMEDMHGHHIDQALVVNRLGIWTTAVIFLLLPLVIAGSVLLAFVWIR
ncbi:MAG: hypothetical protein ACOZCL_13460 [Bacillota bacterium]